jgi:hypothetical protein
MSHTAERVLDLSDRLVRLAPRPLRTLLRRPMSPPETTTEETLRRIARFMFRLAAVAFVSLGVVHMFNFLALDSQYVALDADEDSSAWSWASVTATAMAGVLLALLAATVVSSKGFKFAAAVAIFLSLDDYIRIHENIGSAVTLFPHSVRLLWPIIYLPLLGALFIVLWRICESRAPEVRLMTRSGLLMLVAAVVLEVFTVALFAVDQGHESFGYELEVAFEEGLELAGWLLIAGGMAAALVTQLGRDRSPAEVADHQM